MHESWKWIQGLPAPWLPTPLSKEVLANYESAIETVMVSQGTFLDARGWPERAAYRALTTSSEGDSSYLRRPYGLYFVSHHADVQDMLDYGASLDMLWRIEYGDGVAHWETPLLTALVDERVEAAESLLAAGANVDTPSFYVDQDKNFHAHTALHMMTSRREHSHVSRLVAAGADVDHRTSYGATPVALAAAEDDRQIVELLLEYGADPSLADFFGRTPLDRAGSQTRSLLARCRTD